LQASLIIVCLAAITIIKDIKEVVNPTFRVDLSKEKKEKKREEEQEQEGEPNLS
jgi:hypothetical protein